MQVLRDDIAKLTKAVTDQQKNKVSSLRDEVVREGNEALAYARQQGDKAAKDVEGKINERPFLSVVVMFLVGLLVGKLLDR
jgi:ElaB/YqjD/DUF883 family membrane-anchored ribosome-binding protein